MMEHEGGQNCINYLFIKVLFKENKNLIKYNNFGTSKVMMVLSCVMRVALFLYLQLRLSFFGLKDKKEL